MTNQPSSTDPAGRSEPFGAPTPLAAGPPARDAYPPPRPVMRAIRPLGTAVMVLLSIWGLVEVGALFIALIRVSVIGEEMEAPGSVGVAALTRNDNLYGASGVAGTVTYLATAVLFLVWLFRARDNAEAASAMPHRRSRVWLVLGWIVPVVSLWFPLQIVDDIWRASDPATPTSATSTEGTRTAGVVFGWWVLWLVSNVLGYVFLRWTLDATTLEDIQRAAVIDSVDIVFSLAAGVLFAVVVWRITAFQEARRAVPHTELTS